MAGGHAAAAAGIMPPMRRTASPQLIVGLMETLQFRLLPLHQSTTWNALMYWIRFAIRSLVTDLSSSPLKIGPQTGMSVEPCDVF